MNISDKNVKNFNFEGPEGDTLFWNLTTWHITDESFEEFFEIVTEIIPYTSVSDDRALALIGALVIENAIDSILASYIPDYKQLTGNKDFSLSMKIDLTRALRLCPSHLIGAADAIRRIRNEFSHNLDITFEKCKPCCLQSMEDHLRQIDHRQVDGKTKREMYKNLARMLFIALHAYQIRVSRLNEFIRTSEEFHKQFQSYCEKGRNALLPWE